MSDSMRPLGLQPTRLLRPWDFLGKSTGVGCTKERNAKDRINSKLTQREYQLTILCWEAHRKHSIKRQRSEKLREEIRDMKDRLSSLQRGERKR